MERRNGGLLLPPPRYYRYADAYLEMGRILHEVYGTAVLNPRDVTDTSLLTADADWMRDLARYITEYQYQYDELKRQRG